MDPLVGGGGGSTGCEASIVAGRSAGNSVNSVLSDLESSYGYISCNGEQLKFYELQELHFHLTQLNILYRVPTSLSIWYLNSVLHHYLPSTSTL